MSTENNPVREGLLEELRSARLYDALAQIERNPRICALFTALALAAREQAKVWEQKLRDAGEPVPDDPELDLRARIALMLARVLGVRATRDVLSALKVRGLSVYSSAMPGGHPTPTEVSQIGKRHRTGSGNLRAAVFGVNDGLVSNASLIMGMAGAQADSHLLLLTGVAGLMAGAFSMAAGEYVSVRSQREVFEYQIGLEREELEEYPQAEAEELALIYQAKGFSAADARLLSETLIADPERALDTLAREELGLNPDELGSPWGAAFWSFFAFASGAAVPLLPFLFSQGSQAFIGAIAASGLALFGVGASLSFFTGKAAVSSGLRMLAIGTLAGATTYGIGKLIGVSIG